MLHWELTLQFPRCPQRIPSEPNKSQNHQTGFHKVAPSEVTFCACAEWDWWLADQWFKLGMSIMVVPQSQRGFLVMTIYLPILIHDMKQEGLRLFIHILIIPHAKLNQKHRKASSYESHLSWGYVVVVPNHRILQFCGKKYFFSLLFATFFRPFRASRSSWSPLRRGLRGTKNKANQRLNLVQTIVYQSIHIWFGHVMCARLITIPVVRRVVTTIFMAILLCSLMHVTLEKSFRNQAVTRVETWKPILSIADLSLSPINDLVSSEWVPVGFLMLGFASCSKCNWTFLGFLKAFHYTMFFRSR